MNPRAWLLAMPVSLLVGAAGCSPRSADSNTPSSSGSGAGAGVGAGNGGATTGGLGGSAQSGAAGVGGASGGSGDGNTGGSAGSGAGSGGGGSAGMAGMGSTGGTAGTVGSGGSADCSFEITDSLSPVIPTVGIVDWSTNLGGLTRARIEFTLIDPAPGEINRGSGGDIDITGQTHRALLLGLKADRSYTYRIIAESGDTECTSDDRPITTRSDERPDITWTVTRTPVDGAAPMPGYIVTTNYAFYAYIIDTDGDLVWWASSPRTSSRARMDWEGQHMWMLQVAGNPGATSHVRRVSMDGTEVLDAAGLETAHHDLAVVPGGIVATLSWTLEASEASDLVERLPDGTVKTVVRLDDRVFGNRTSFHANSIAYHASDDTYTVGDLAGVGYVKLSRRGEPLWQFLAGCASMPVAKCASGDLLGNHGHHLLDDGTFLVFKGRQAPSIVHAYELTETATTLSATQVWTYDPGNSLTSTILGDVQRLPNENTLVTYSTSNEMREVAPSGDVVQTIKSTNALGYADFRETLYGPPPR